MDLWNYAGVIRIGLHPPTTTINNRETRHTVFRRWTMNQLFSALGAMGSTRPWTQGKRNKEVPLPYNCPALSEEPRRRDGYTTGPPVRVEKIELETWGCWGSWKFKAEFWKAGSYARPVHRKSAQGSLDSLLRAGPCAHGVNTATANKGWPGCGSWTISRAHTELGDTWAPTSPSGECLLSTQWRLQRPPPPWESLLSLEWRLLGTHSSKAKLEGIKLIHK